MVRAILAGTKTQTRRVVKAPKAATVYERKAHWDRAYVDPGPSPAGNPGPYLKLPISGGDLDDEEIVERVYPRWSVGDRLWVKETFTWIRGNGIRPWYRADGDPTGPNGEPPRWESTAHWHPSIHMPRRVSRITLEVTSLRVERAQDISEEDAQAEGVEGASNHLATYGARQMFAELWQSINGKRPGCSWESNPWVWVVSFRRRKC
jgi:hypothetical protein